MPGTFSQILLHVVFATKRREPWIDADLSEHLYPYMGGIIRAEGGTLHEIGGVADHVHLLLRMKPDQALSDLMRTVKARSSVWVHHEFPERREFGWQEGYSAFSVSKSNEEAVKRYIRTQADHHAREDFRSELVRILRAHGVEFEERFVAE